MRGSFGLIMRLTAANFRVFFCLPIAGGRAAGGGLLRRQQAPPAPRSAGAGA